MILLQVQHTSSQYLAEIRPVENEIIVYGLYAVHADARSTIEPDVCCF
jgi:hypothetical protein